MPFPAICLPPHPRILIGLIPHQGRADSVSHGNDVGGMGVLQLFLQEALLWDPGDVLTSDHFKQYLPYLLVLEFCVFVTL